MALREQEFYEGAALHLIARSGKITALNYEPPFFTINNKLSVCLKHSTREEALGDSRSPPMNRDYSVLAQNALS